ncbi:MAG: FtsH-binding integral membrane protein [Sediminicola sp.]|jgi:FtsH-binding integral membrane protein|tara:strand:+ start:3047 stop:3244 length:198 start_codon:yes stop_codon:yes gene_type:complete
MGNKIYRLFEYAYLLMAVFSAYIVFDNWEENRGRSYLFALFGIVAVLMFFFKRKFRKKIEAHHKK